MSRWIAPGLGRRRPEDALDGRVFLARDEVRSRLGERPAWRATRALYLDRIETSFE
jgi:hypothetical protein